MSDLHQEFARSQQAQSFVDSLDTEGVDVLILAGDISGGSSVYEHVNAIARRFQDAQILWVKGNHEYYGNGRRKLQQMCTRLTEEHEHLHVLDNNVVTINNQRFLGTTLWYEPNVFVRMMQESWSDFRAIKSLSHWLRGAYQAGRDFLNAELQAGDVLITHMLPSPYCVSPRWVGSSTNPFFVTNVHDLIVERKPAICVHGHTHDSRDLMIGSTRIVCNPRGYVNHELNEEFDPDASFTL